MEWKNVNQKLPIPGFSTKWGEFWPQLGGNEANKERNNTKRQSFYLSTLIQLCLKLDTSSQICAFREPTYSLYGFGLFSLGFVTHNLRNLEYQQKQ